MLGYDRKHQLTKETQRDDEDTDIYAWEWAYDLAGNRTYQDFNGEKTYYTYDTCKQLTHEITDGVPTYYQHDGCGNQTAKQEGAGTTYFQFDHENLMTRVDFPDGSHNYFSYDADGKRTSIGDSEGYRKLIYQGPDMLKLLQERDASNDPVAQYTMGLGLESVRRGGEGDLDNGTTSFFHYDALGSTQELTDSNENTTDTYRYNAWGQILVRTGTTTNPHTYVGKHRYYLTPDPLLYLLGLRYYDLSVGRFLSLDPAILSTLCLDMSCDIIDYRELITGGAASPTERGLYEYAPQAPTKFTDPAGLYKLEPSCEEYADFIRTGMFWLPRSSAFRNFLCCLRARTGGALKQPMEVWMKEWEHDKGNIRVSCGDDFECRLVSRWTYGFCCGHASGYYDIQLCFAALHEVYYKNKLQCDFPNVECVFMHEQVHLFLPIGTHEHRGVKECWDKHLAYRCPFSGKPWTA